MPRPLGYARIVATAIVLTTFWTPGTGADEPDALLDQERSRSAVGERTDPPRPAPEHPTRPSDPLGPEENSLAAGADDPVSPGPAPPRERVIEEIIVTAQKREQSLRDVPISMSVLDDEFLDQGNVTDYQDLSRFVPNFVVDNASSFPDLRVRGLGSQLNNKAFEQAVGLSIDGIPYGRSHYFIGPLFDVDRVEVLRGPQGSLFGKNTTAGLLNVTTKRPTGELTGFIDGELGELDRRRFEAGIGGPIVERIVDFRLSGILDERDGIIANTTHAVAPGANETMNGRKRKGVRAQLGFPDLFGTDLVVSYEKVNVDLFGTGFELLSAPPGAVAFFREWDPRADVTPGNFVGSLDGPEFAAISLDTVVANATHNIGDWRIDGTAGHSAASFESFGDVDINPAPMIYIKSFDRNPQTTFELRLSSPPLPGFFGLDRPFDLTLGSSDFTAGFFWQSREVADSSFSVAFNTPVLAQFLAYQNAGGPAGAVDEFIGPAVPVGDIGVFDTTESIEEGTLFFDQSQTALAGFGQLTWRPIDRWALQYGMRVSSERKRAHWNRVTTQGSGVILAAVNQEEFMLDLSLSEFAVTPEASLTWDWTEQVSLYARWANGFKAGGFNEFALNDDQQIQFDTETSTSWELGTKTSLLGGAANLNLGLFWQHVTDLQVLTILPDELVPQVLNAGEARVRGVEADATWLLTDWATLRGASAFTDSEFLEFPFGTCTQDRPNTDGDEDDRCDQTGQPFFRSPKWTTALTGAVHVPFSSLLGPARPGLLPWDGIELIGSLTGEYRDVHFVSDTFDPRTRQPSFFRFDGSLGFGDPAEGWSLRVVAENLTNQDVKTIIREIPLGDANFTQRLEAPRLVFGSFRWAF